MLRFKNNIMSFTHNEDEGQVWYTTRLPQGAYRDTDSYFDETNLQEVIDVFDIDSKERLEELTLSEGLEWVDVYLLQVVDAGFDESNLERGLPDPVTTIKGVKKILATDIYQALEEIWYWYIKDQQTEEDWLYHWKKVPHKFMDGIISIFEPGYEVHYYVLAKKESELGKLIEEQTLLPVIQKYIWPEEKAYVINGEKFYAHTPEEAMNDTINLLIQRHEEDNGAYIELETRIQVVTRMILPNINKFSIENSGEV